MIALKDLRIIKNMKLFSGKKTEGAGMECLFKKHGIQSGKIIVKYMSYWETSNVVNIAFEVTADGIEHCFSTRVSMKGSEKELLDSAFASIAGELDTWLGIARSYKSLETNLLGKVVFEWDAGTTSSKA